LLHPLISSGIKKETVLGDSQWRRGDSQWRGSRPCERSEAICVYICIML